MSRSRKKIACTKDSGKGKTWAKRQANKKVRRTEGIPNGKQYRKVFCSWDIFDWKHIEFDPTSEWYRKFKRK